jgi:hypothetical protein
MPLPTPIPGRRGSPLTLLALALLAATAIPALARDPQPLFRFPLEPFGYQPIASRYLLEGATMLTLDYVDDRHLLVTFGIARLMPRLADCPPDDSDRTVRAVLLELPTGRELARTEWRFHDVGQYLWDLGGGVFMLRNRDTLTTFTPLQNLASGHPFVQQTFLHFERRIKAIEVSANHDLLSVETVKREPPQPADPNPGPPQPAPRRTGLLRRDPAALSSDPRTPTDAAKPDRVPFEINFIRLHHSDPATGSDDVVPSRVVPSIDGRIHTSKSVTVPLTSEGFLRSQSFTRDGVLLDFLTFEGKDIDLGDFPTSCPPRPTFISPSEFIAFGCRGADGSLDLAGFNLHGDFIWQINFTDEQAYPSIASAIPAGRFAFSRTVTSTHVFGSETPSPDQLQAQEVRVIQMYNGKQLLRVTTSPIQRAGQNFALSPDGLSLAVIHDTLSPVKGGGIAHNTAVEIYPLPPLSDKDVAQVRIEAAMAPKPSRTPMRFSIDEIKEALANNPASASPDSRIAGDAIRPPSSEPLSSAAGSTAGPTAGPTAGKAESSTGTIPSSDPGPGCSAVSGGSSGDSAVCHTRQAAADPANATPEGRRKPPTLYEPAPATPPQ